MELITILLWPPRSSLFRVLCNVRMKVVSTLLDMWKINVCYSKVDEVTLFKTLFFITWWNKNNHVTCLLLLMLNVAFVLGFQGTVNQTTSCQHKLSKKVVQHIGEVLSCKNRNKTSVPVFYRIIKFSYSLKCV